MNRRGAFYYKAAHPEECKEIFTSSDIPEFAVRAIARWRIDIGRQRFPHATQLLILTDTGESLGCWSCSHKLTLQVQLSDRYGQIVGHHPTCCSKWNPIKHRLFSQISLYWVGKPLGNLQTKLNYILAQLPVPG